MLDDSERRILDELERDLAGDPAFAARMADPAGVSAFPTISVLCVLLFLAFPIVMVLFGWPGLIVALDLFAVAVAGVLIHRRRRA